MARNIIFRITNYFLTKLHRTFRAGRILYSRWKQIQSIGSMTRCTVLEWADLKGVESFIKTIKLLEAAEMSYIRRIMRISWTEKKPNEAVMEMAGYKRYLLKTIRKRQLQFFGHINRADGLEKQTLSGKICGAKSRGRQRIKCTVRIT